MQQTILLDQDELEEMFRRVATFAVTNVLERVADNPTPELMTKRELAKYLRCSEQKINRLMKSGLPCERFGDSPRYRKTDIDRYLREKRTTLVKG